MNTKIVLFTMLAAMFVLAGCTTQTGPANLDPFIGGSEGLEMEFISGSPPAEIYDQNFAFSVGVRIENLGESDIESNNGFVEIRGISPQEFGISKADLKQDIPEILGARKNADGSVLQGNSDVVTFEDLTYEQDLAGNLNIDQLQVRACYDYQTQSSTLLCIKQDNIDGLKDNELCRVDSEKVTANSGAPIQVTQLSESSRGARGIQISFEVGHVGPIGNKWFPEGDDTCDDRINNQDLYKVEVEVGPIINGQYAASCTGGSFNSGNTGTVTLYNGEPARVVCRFDVGDQEADFETPVSIDLRYRYLESISTSLLIKDLGNQ